MSFAETEQHVRADEAAALILSAGLTLNGTYIVGTDAVEPSTAGLGSALRLLSDGTLVVVVDDGFESDAALVTVDDVSAEQGARVRLVNTAYLADGTIVFKTDDPITDLDYTLETDSLFTDIVNNTIVKKAADAVFGGAILIPNVVDEALASPSEAGDRIIGMTLKGQSIEAASQALNRFALLSAAGGSQIAALSATSLVDDAVMLHASDNRAKSGLWVDVRGSSMQADSFSAGSTTYGVKSDLYGATVGVDFAASQETSIGLALSAGSGSVRGQKTGAGTKNDVDYWGVNLYGTYSMGAWGELTASIGYLQTSNDLAQDELSADPNVSAYSASVRYAKTFETAPGVTVTPHAGVRWTYLDADDFIAGGMSYESEKVHLAAFPLGATVAKTFETPSGWRLAPYLDLEVAPQVGDTKTDNVVSISGGSTEDVIDTRIASSVVYSARIGVSGDFSEAHAFGFSAGISAGNEGYSSQYVKASYRFAF